MVHQRTARSGHWVWA